MFHVITVPDDAPDRLEQIGTKAKFWYENDEKVHCLFKLGRPDTGDDWSEKVACHLCELLGIPHAVYELAVHKGLLGVVSPTFVPPGGHLVHGNELLAKIDPRYPVKKFRKVREHTLTGVLAILRLNHLIESPIGCNPFGDVNSAVDFFIGYLMLDVWIANQDRHHENWGLVISSQGKVHLAPSYDHASCLGANETDENREKRLTTKDPGQSIGHYVTRAKSAFYASRAAKKMMKTMDTFRKAVSHRPEAGRAWLQRLSEVSSEDVSSIFERLPKDRLSDVAIRFSSRLLGLNRKRLLDVMDELK